MSTTDVELPDPNDGITGPTSATARRNGGTNRSGGVTITEPDSPVAADSAEQAPAEPDPAAPAS